MFATHCRAMRFSDRGCSAGTGSSARPTSRLCQTHESTLLGRFAQVHNIGLSVLDARHLEVGVVVLNDVWAEVESCGGKEEAHLFVQRVQVRRGACACAACVHACMHACVCMCVHVCTFQILRTRAAQRAQPACRCSMHAAAPAAPSPCCGPTHQVRTILMFCACIQYCLRHCLHLK